MPLSDIEYMTCMFGLNMDRPARFSGRRIRSRTVRLSVSITWEHGSFCRAAGVAGVTGVTGVDVELAVLGM